MMRQKLDSQAIMRLQPNDVTAYLHATGWNRVGSWRDAPLFQKSVARGKAEVVQPVRTDIPDYMNLLGQLLADLSDVEERDVRDILHDVQQALDDVVRVRVVGAPFADGTVPLEKGVRAMALVGDLTTYAAWSAESPRIVLQGRRPDRLTEFLRDVRMGQTEPGSYVFTVQVRLPPVIAPDLFGDAPEPFARKVTSLLYEGVKEAVAIAGGAEEDMRERLNQHKISANMCETIAALVTDIEADHAEISVRWAPARFRAGLPTKPVSVSRSVAATLREIGRVVCASTPVEAQEVVGRIVKAAADDVTLPTLPKTITLETVAEGKLRKVRIDLEPEDYRRALEFHADNVAAYCRGTLVREGQAWRLRNPVDFGAAAVEEP